MASIRISTRCMTIPYPKVINHTVLSAFYRSIFYKKASCISQSLTFSTLVVWVSKEQRFYYWVKAFLSSNRMLRSTSLSFIAT